MKHCLTLIVMLMVSQVSIGQTGPHRKIFGSAPVASFVQATGCRGITVTNCTTPAINVTSGHGLVFCAGANNTSTVSSIAISTGTDTLASFTSVFAPQVISGDNLDCRYLLSTTASGSTTFTLTLSANAAFNIIVFEIISSGGLDAVPPALVANTTAGHTAISCPNYTTAHGNALAICWTYSNSSATSYVASTGFTIPTGGTNLSSGGSTGAMEYESGVGSGAALTPGMTVSPLSNASFSSSFAFY